MPFCSVSPHRLGSDIDTRATGTVATIAEPMGARAWDSVQDLTDLLRRGLWDDRLQDFESVVARIAKQPTSSPLDSSPPIAGRLIIRCRRWIPARSGRADRPPPGPHQTPLPPILH